MRYRGLAGGLSLVSIANFFMFEYQEKTTKKSGTDNYGTTLSFFL